MIFRLRYRGFVIFCGIMTLYIYYSILQLTVDIYYEDPYSEVKRKLVRDTQSSSVSSRSNVTNSTGIIANITTTVAIARQHANCTEQNVELSCSNISDITILNSLGHGTTKEVFRGVYGGREMAVKMVTSKVADVKRCLQRKKYWKEQDCYLLANYKVLKEILFVQQLHHPNILQRIGYCVRNEKTSGKVGDHGVISVTELGHEFKPNKYSQLPWEQKMTTTIELLDLLDYMENSPLGSLMMTDMKTSQFLVVNSKVKLGDMDDVTSDEQNCQTKKDCYIANVNYGIECVKNICKGINAKFNLHYFNIAIFSVILRNGTSASMTKAIRALKHRNSTALQIKQSLQQILLQ